MLNLTQPPMNPQNQDLNELIQDWLQALTLQVNSGELAGVSSQAYSRGANRFLEWCNKSGIELIDADTLREWKAALLAEGYKPASVNIWLAGLKSMFAWAVENQRIPYNPADNIKCATRRGTGKKHTREMLTDVEVRRVLALPDDTLAGKRDSAILHLMAYTGARSIEVNRANLNDLRTTAGKLVLDIIGKGHQEADRMLVLANPKAEAAMYDWLAVRGDFPGPLFISFSDRNKHQRLGLRALRGIVKKYFLKAGVRGNKTTHSLRHTAISKAIQNGSPMHSVRSMAGHEDTNTTMKYFHEVDRITNPAEAFISYGENGEGNGTNGLQQ